MRQVTKRLKYVISVLISAVYLPQLYAYPLDGEESGIQRLKGYQLAQTTKGSEHLPIGALLSINDIHLNLVNVEQDVAQDKEQQDLDLNMKAVQPQLQTALDSIFKNRDPSYSVLLIDYSDPKNIVWAGRNIDNKQNVGSVGKIVTMLGFFNALAEAFPDIKTRQKILRETKVRGDTWVIYDEHKVPQFNPDTGVNRFAVLKPDDVFVLSEWLDHMASASANGAGSVVWREAMLIQHFGNRYPVSIEEANDFFKSTPKKILGELSVSLTSEPLTAAGLDIKNIQQGSFWTSTGKQKIPGTESFASTKELGKYLLKMEQGKLVDAWSSLEIKRYLYMTRRRYRYVYAPELNNSAVFFKSGSLYQCQPEEGYRCAKYMGNKRNMMNSIAIVESLPGAEQRYQYLVALTSNVLKINSAWDHSRFAAAIHKAVLTREKVVVQEDAKPDQIQKAGQGD